MGKNVFHLNPPPPPPPPPETKPADLPQYKLTGIVKIGDKQRVMFALAPKDAKEQWTYLSLAPGEKQGLLELVSVNKEKEFVDVINSGMAMTLSVASNSFASKGAAPPSGPAAPGVRRLPGFPAPPPPAPGPAQASASGGGAVIIGGGGNSSGGDNNTQPNPAGGNAGGGNSGGGYSGVSVAGASTPASYGGGTGGAQYGNGASVGVNGTTLNLNGAPQNAGATRNWPPVQQIDPVAQMAALQAAAQGVPGALGQQEPSGVYTPGGPKNSPGGGGPPMPPMPPPRNGR